jgi:hypothetical protein
MFIFLLSLRAIYRIGTAAPPSCAAHAEDGPDLLRREN